MHPLIERAEQRRRAATANLDAATALSLGQHFTPAQAADLVASLPTLDDFSGRVRVLDPGAGSGSLSASLVARLAEERPDLSVHVVAVELDAALVPMLAATLADLETLPGVSTELVVGDFLELSTGLNPDPRLVDFDLVILNPPYGKLAAGSPARVAVARSLVDCPNWYAAFWALSVAALAPHGQVVAIVPRSWANGTYFEPFRRWLLERLRLDKLHIFEDRGTVFKDTSVLQETVIVSGTRTDQRGTPVVLSSSVAHLDAPQRVIVPASAVIQPEDPHAFVRFTDGAAAVPPAARFTLADLGLSVSTGRVVDFRCRDFLETAPAPGAAPMIYPGNLSGGRVEWPREIRKPQYFHPMEDRARRLLVPAGAYCLTKRFSAKEERRRVVAAAGEFGTPPAFDNKLNYFHSNGRPLSVELARGLSVWLNSSPVDALFRTFSGHTQVNAGDLFALPFPSHAELVELGLMFPEGLPDQDDLDCAVLGVLSREEAA